MSSLPPLETSTGRSGGGIGETIRVIVEALLIAVVIRTFLFQPFNIPSGSLIPTLLIGDYLFVSKYSYGYSKHSFPFSIVPLNGRIWAGEPERGDIAVFKLPKDNETDYIKRVIGLPGDKVQVLDGRLRINGQVVQKQADGFVEDRDAFGRKARVPRFRETLPNGVTYHVIEREGDRGYFDNTVEYTVPVGHYFMMGDNRDNSTDSRDLQSVGYVPFENFVGKAQVIFFSIEEGAQAWQLWRWPTDVRWGRIFQKVR
ncbi:LepB Signal peptidase I [Rhabdaerophilaceae bacterium]